MLTSKNIKNYLSIIHMMAFKQTKDDIPKVLLDTRFN